MTLNSKKTVIKDQKYENYWKLTLGTSAFFDDQFIRTLSIIINHIDKYKLSSKNIEELVVFSKTTNKIIRVNEKVVHYKELQTKIQNLYPNDTKDLLSTRKQINQYVKLGFIKPHLAGYSKTAKDYIKPNNDRDTLQRLFSDTVYEYSSFNSSVTKDDTESNQIKFLVKTLLNRKVKKLTFRELIGLMQINISKYEYAKEKDIQVNVNWANNINFEKRKYNQINHFITVLKSLKLFQTVGSRESFQISLIENAKEFLPKKGETKRDTYRFSLMKQAVYKESEEKYGNRICWFSKEPSVGLVVSHIYASKKALENWDIDEAYDPNNAFLLKPGDIDGYFDKYKMTFDENGKPIFSGHVREDFRNNVNKNNYRIDDIILNKERLNYLKIHNDEFYKKNSFV
ncbi:HNH endonuclease [Staphylococcus chromogenes]|uniref:HNH endonuclease n=1 Tax=Staphylococcus chromogenes TaxID=46126 RepID=UPI000E6A45BA|nr:HNH endonuclease [Staphylococcus chromogenes]RIM15444.1 HNH endonuclease [Staphylococcus chromogenes]